MKTINKIHAFFIIVLLAVGVSISPKTWAQYYDYEPSYDEFYDELSPYGDWMDYPSYGRVWRPRVEPDFQPYGTNGRWEMTEYGNTWVSDYPWGWAPFHYGRWTFDSYYGWIWIPGNEWGPAWVTWRSGGGYYGWAPLGPGMGLDINININIPYNYWVFVPEIYVRSPRVYSYCVPRNRISGIWGGTSYLNNYYRYNNRAYVFGPHRYDLERATRNRVSVYRADDLYRNYRPNSPYRRDNERFAQGSSRRNNNYNNRDGWENRRDNNNNWGQNSPRNDNQNTQNRRNDRFDNNTRPRESERRVQQPERTLPESNRRDERPYQAPERGNARRTWGDNGGSNPQSPDNQEQFRQQPQENRQSSPRRTWSDNGSSNQQPRENTQPRNFDNRNSGQQQRGNREYPQQHLQEKSQRNNSPERPTENRQGRRGRD